MPIEEGIGHRPVNFISVSSTTHLPTTKSWRDPRRERRADPRTARAHVWPGALLGNLHGPPRAERLAGSHRRRRRGAAVLRRQRRAAASAPAARATTTTTSGSASSSRARTELDHEAFALEMAKQIMAFVMSGWKTTAPNGKPLPCPGGVPFSNAAGNTSRNTVTDGPAAELAVVLYRITHEAQYLLREDGLRAGCASAC